MLVYGPIAHPLGSYNLVGEARFAFGSVRGGRAVLFS